MNTALANSEIKLPTADAPVQRVIMEYQNPPFSWSHFWGEIGKIGLGLVGTGVLTYLIMKYFNPHSQPSTKKVLSPQPTQNLTSLDNIVGKKTKEFDTLLDAINNHAEYQRFGINIPKSLLLYGKPGTGKTELARGLANKIQAPYFELCGSDLESMWVGQASDNISLLFKAARAHVAKDTSEKPIKCVIFIDELETIAPHRSSGFSSSHHTNQTVGTLLTQLTQNNQGILFIGATNHKELIDPAILRPGRFDMHIEIPLPDKETRKKILEHYASKHCKKSKIDFELIAKNTDQLSGAHLKELCEKALRNAAYAKKQNVEQADFAEALKIIQGTSPENHEYHLSMYA